MAHRTRSFASFSYPVIVLQVSAALALAGACSRSSSEAPAPTVPQVQRDSAQYSGTPNVEAEQVRLEDQDEEKPAAAALAAAEPAPADDQVAPAADKADDAAKQAPAPPAAAAPKPVSVAQGPAQTQANVGAARGAAKIKKSADHSKEAKRMVAEKDVAEPEGEMQVAQAPMPVAQAPVPAASVAQAATPEFNTERYDHATEQAFTHAKSSPLSTFSIDVDTASYSNIRRFVNNGQTVEPGAVRVEEMINYFNYDYAEPTGSVPFSVTTEVSTAPWAPEHQLVLIGLQGRHVDTKALPPRNLVFLLDVSGSMEDENKLPLLKRSFSKLLDTLGERDRVAIVVYAGASGLVLPSTRASDRKTIEAALERLSAGGSTNGADGIQLAYQVAEANAVKGGINRVILATDGDFNVGTTSESALTELIEEKREHGVSLTVLGFGMGNYNDSTLERLADNGNGNYAYIDTLDEAQKVLVTEASGTMLTIAKDVKIQVEFNPAVVGAYRLIGYDNRRLADRDFNDDRKDAGEIGAGHRVTALYEVLTPAQAKKLSGVDALKYQAAEATSNTDEMLTVKLRYKEPTAKTSQLLKVPVANRAVALERASNNLRFASAVATFGMYLRKSEYGGNASPRLALDLANGSVGHDQHGYRKEFIQLVSAVAGENRQAVAR